jgi:hypothetical protein
MTKSSHSTAPFSRFALSCAVALGVLFAAGSASAQNGTKLDGPVSKPAPAPTRSPAPPSAMKAAILRKAESDYYILQSQGLKAFQCSIQPNWSQVVTDPAQLAAVRQVQYTAVIDAQGGVQVNPFQPNGLPIDPSLNQMVSGLQETITGFFQTWNSMVLTGMFSADSDTQLVYSSQADGYHFSQKSANTSVDITLTKDALMTAMKVTTQSSVIAMQPAYIATDKGLLLTSMNSDIDNGKQKVNFQIQYQDVESFEMPAMAAYQVTLPDQVVSIDMSFSAYQIVKQ